MTAAGSTTGMRAGRTTAVVLLAGAALGVGAWLWPATAATAPPPPADRLALPERPPEAFALTVLAVYDGDTIQAQVRSTNEFVAPSALIRIRLIGIDTPEVAHVDSPTPECWADEAHAHLAQLLPEGSTVWGAPDRDEWDDYGRRLLHLWTDDGRFVQSELVAGGDAAALRIWPDVAFSDLLTSLQREAQAAGRGQWGACP